jgi:MFS family permease
MAIIQHQVPHLTDVGFPIAIAAGALGAIGLANAVGKFVFGLACDWINPKYARAAGMSLQIVAVVILLNVGPTSSALLVWLYSILIGLGLGSWLPTMSLLVTTNFGLAAYGTILGMTSVFNMGGGSFGPLFAGYIFDTQHDYHTAFVTFLLLYILSLAATLLIRRPRISPDQQR